MKRVFLLVALSAILLSGGIKYGISQEQPVPQKDTVNIDTDAKPTFYYAVEDEEEGTESGKEKGSAGLIAIIAAVVVAGGVGFFLLKKKK
ncbi:MAG: hypothetical protein K0B05_01165 [Bacteroidales bacterium]|nr:hypothetical protein [Bacteroidales bacterium]